ncbi:tubulin-specific chaperone E isoform X2 [Bombina bombina]|uniref:tubulin-specific chaperone E isoform X2 n=1 Tax=Bombina bombina TaxID=8345 RepID=UPI00235A7651|nr:tubulin-specific chaperone E isoform X2 [Bombina bombina]
MIDPISSDAIGKRIICDGECATVRYVGNVPPTQGPWLGVEWDNPQRGKHDGTHNGEKYFTCSHPTGGSFIRPKKADFGVDFLTALNKRYGLKVEQTEELVLGKRTVELVGFESVHEEQSQLNKLRDISLRECGVSHAGDKEDIYNSCPNITILNLSKNLLSSWENVADITKQLKELQSLYLSENRLSLSSSPPTLADAFLNLKILSLNQTGITWTEVLYCAAMWPSIEELHLASNDITVLERPVDSLQKLKLLDISNNKLNDGNQLHALGYLPRLSQLIVSNNNISSFNFPDVQFGHTSVMLSKLNILFVNGNNISQWSVINELNKLESLQSLNCQNNPLMESAKNPETVRQLIIAKIAKLKVLNRIEILAQERKGAELDYRKMFGNDWLKAGGSQNPDLNKPNVEFLTAHPRYLELIKKFGAPDEGELKQQQPFALKNQLLNSMTVQKVKGLLYRLLKVPGSEMKLSYESAKMEGREIEMENDLKPLQFYSVENGDCMLVRW